MPCKPAFGSAKKIQSGSYKWIHHCRIPLKPSAHDCVVSCVDPLASSHHCWGPDHHANCWCPVFQPQTVHKKPAGWKTLTTFKNLCCNVYCMRSSFSLSPVASHSHRCFVDAFWWKPDYNICLWFLIQYRTPFTSVPLDFTGSLTSVRTAEICLVVVSFNGIGICLQKC